MHLAQASPPFGPETWGRTRKMFLAHLCMNLEKITFFQRNVSEKKKFE
jgi:hypothetical protein